MPPLLTRTLWPGVGASTTARRRGPGRSRSTRAAPSPSSSTLAGLTSWWTRPRSCSACRPARRLDGDVEQVGQAAKRPLADGVGEGAAGGQVGEDDDLVAEGAEEAAGGEVGVVGQVEPGLQLGEEEPAAVGVERGGCA